MTRTRLEAAELSEVMAVFSRSLATHREVLNRLNVYPVPDGDTGTNMQLTVDSVVRELAVGPGDLQTVCKAVSHGSLMGARGNSGVILCQLLRGMCEVFAEAGAIDGAVFAVALARAEATARESVVRPVEGTILTVAGGAADGARRAVEDGAGLSQATESAYLSAVEALAATPTLLPVLEKAGVVDAGGAGLLLLLASFAHVATGREMPAELPLPESVVENLSRGGGGAAASLVALPADGSESVSELRYEVMYMLEAPDESIPAFKEVWAGLGDSIVVVGGDGLWNCHIHTDDIGAAVEASLDAGRPRSIRVTDLHEQVEEESWVVRAADAGTDEVEGVASQRTSVIAVATGEGIRRIFHSLGVRHIVAGGQSMNPSTAQILEMIDTVPGEEVILLPNNKNIFAVAAQAAAVAGRPTEVVTTAGIQEGFAALLEYDPEASAADNAAAMTTAAERVVAAEVTRAVRASETPAGHVEPGDWIGLRRNGIAVVAASAAEAACRLLDSMVDEGREIVTLIEGSGASPAETRRITEWLAENRPGVAVELHHGGQPLYPYLLATE